MDHELLKTFDINKRQIGVATREEVHRLGHWHEVFHCWFVSIEAEKDYIYLQLRSEAKQDYPGLLDITAAGHLLADETVLDGPREIKEELGIDVSMEELESLGIINYSVVREDFIDKEIANLFLYRYSQTLAEFTLQKEEVAGIFKADFGDFCQLWTGELKQIRVEGFELDSTGNRMMINKMVESHHFVPHELSFYQSVVQLMKAALRHPSVKNSKQ